MKNLYHLDPTITFLNHGSFGACPKPVIEEYQGWQLKLERQPVDFMVRAVYDYLKEARDILGEFVGCEGDDLVFVTNPTTAVNTIIRSLGFLKPGDEVLTTDQEYGSLIRAWNYYAEEKGFSLVQHRTKLPMTGHGLFAEDFLNSVTDKTRLLFISHITSATGVILPVKEICRWANDAGIMTIIDGAHVPAHIPLDIADLGADIYVGACHKWLSAPKGASFMVVKKSLQDTIKPLIISWGSVIDPAPTPFIYENQYQGTWDPSAFLTVPKAIQFQKDHDWESVKKRCRNLIGETRDRVYEIIDTDPICLNSEEWLGQMASVIIPIQNGLEFKWKLLDKYKIEIPVFPWNDKVLFRISFNAYNDENDADRLIDVLKKEF